MKDSLLRETCACSITASQALWHTVAIKTSSTVLRIADFFSLFVVAPRFFFVSYLQFLIMIFGCKWWQFITQRERGVWVLSVEPNSRAAIKKTENTHRHTHTHKKKQWPIHFVFCWSRLQSWTQTDMFIYVILKYDRPPQESKNSCCLPHQHSRHVQVQLFHIKTTQLAKRDCLYWYVVHQYVYKIGQWPICSFSVGYGGTLTVQYFSILTY